MFLSPARQAMDHDCDIYLRLSAAELPAAGGLEAAIREAAPAALLVTSPEKAGGDFPAFVEAIKRQNLAILIEQDWSLARELDLDGVHIQADVGALAEARRALGASKSIGVSCGLSRHEAMVLAEAGADYLAFGETGQPDLDACVDMLGWWSELFEVPCVAWLRKGEGLDVAEELVRAGADFLAVDYPGSGVSGMIARASADDND